MSKKRKPLVVHNVDSVNLEIDYDKLAEAIVKANNIANATKSADQPVGKKLSFFKELWMILRNKRTPDGRMTTSFFSTVISCIFRGIAFIGFLLTGAFIYTLFHGNILLAWGTVLEIITNIFSIIIIIGIIFIVALYSVIMRGVANEIKAEKDKHYIISVFSSITGFAALVIALIALLKGVAG